MPNPPRVQSDWFGLSGAIRRSVAEWLHGQGYRYCAAHRQHRGAVVPLDQFHRDDQNKTRKLSGYCRQCQKEYKRGATSARSK